MRQFAVLAGSVAVLAVVLIMLVALLASCAVSESMDEIKARVLNAYALPTTHPAAAASLLGLPKSPAPEDECVEGVPRPTEVTMQVYVDRLHTLNQDDQTYGFDGYLRAWWIDPRLRFNESEAASCGAPPALSLTRAESLTIVSPRDSSPGHHCTRPHPADERGRPCGGSGDPISTGRRR